MRYAVIALDESVTGDVVVISTDPDESFVGIPICVGTAADCHSAIGRHLATNEPPAAPTTVVPASACRRELVAAMTDQDDAA